MILHISQAKREKLVLAVGLGNRLLGPVTEKASNRNRLFLEKMVVGNGY